MIYIMHVIMTRFGEDYIVCIKNPIKQDLLQILVLVRQQNFLNC